MTKNEIILSGGQAIALGAIAGGCDFLSFYPMSPSTGIATFLAQQTDPIDIIVEQTEDEISAVNMALGAWYAGARGMVVTSGGGFDLMTEGISLAGISETPIVVHIGQRPGPGTGLPTRTEQGDIELALYSGHGEYPRIIFTPGTLEDAFFLTQKAFNLADKYQIPVFILTDQYLIDSYYNIPQIDLSKIRIEQHILETVGDYKRYKITNNGLSPRGIPGFGKGLVCVDSDEHDEEGHITEDFVIRSKMVDKRLSKMELITKEIISPQLIGNKDYRTLVIGWGSTYNSIKEALEILDREDIAFLHFRQVHPLHQDTKRYIKKADKAIVIENNSTSQFSKLLTLGTGIELRTKILKYNGMPFSVEEILEKMKKFLK